MSKRKPDLVFANMTPGTSFFFRKVEVFFTKSGELQVDGSTGKRYVIFSGHSGGGCASRLRCLVILDESGEVHAFSGMNFGPQMIDTKAILEDYGLS